MAISHYSQQITFMHVLNAIHQLCIMSFTSIAKKQIVMIQVEKKQKYYLLPATDVLKNTYYIHSTLSFIVKIEKQGFYLGISIGCYSRKLCIAYKEVLKHASKSDFSRWKYLYIHVQESHMFISSHWDVKSNSDFKKALYSVWMLTKLLTYSVKF